MDDASRYNAIEETLQIINREYISLPVAETRNNNEVLAVLLEELIEKCKEKSRLFSEIYTGIFYGGSFYDGLKIKQPDEYDIDIKFIIPYEDEISPSNENGYINLKLTKIPNRSRKLWNKWRRCFRPFYGEPGMHVLINSDDYLDTDKVMLWMHQILSESLGGKKRGKTRIVKNMKTERGHFNLKFVRKGPAFTFRVSNTDGIVINFDLVPCFVFGEDQWPSNGFRKNPVPEKPEFFIVPKPLKDNPIGTRYWRLSFQEQERQIILSKERLKPTLRLLKKMRDTMQHDDISSYFIKTVLLWEAFKKSDDDNFWYMPLSYVFMEILMEYERSIKNGIPYFWYKQLNLIKDIKKQTLTKISVDLTYIIRNIQTNPDNKLLIAKYLLTNRELKEFKKKNPQIR